MTDINILITELFVNYTAFKQLVMSCKSTDEISGVTKIKVRPVVISGKNSFQVEFFTQKQVRHKNFLAEQADELKTELLSNSFTVIDILTNNEAIQIKRNKSGDYFVRRNKLKENSVKIATENNVGKNYILKENQPNDFLIKLGFSDKNCKIFAAKYAKFKQINHFLTYMTGLKIFDKPDHEIVLIDCGCGKAYLSLAVYYWLFEIKRLRVRLIGLDTDLHVVKEAQKLAGLLGFKKAEFVQTSINDFVPPVKPDLVFSLHACDTATDMALALAVNYQAENILAIPCCQHELHDQIKNQMFRPILKHGILKERLADIYTDAVRALKLRISGYRADVLEFISEEFTAKNIMIRAEKIKGSDPDRANLEKEYQELLTFLGVVPAIEKLIKSE